MSEVWGTPSEQRLVRLQQVERPPLFGAVEGGGTKFVCAVGRGPDHIVARTRISTTTPPETLERVCDFLARAAGEQPLAAVGVACFGPLELDERSPHFGSMLPTNKRGWTGAPIHRLLRTHLGVPVAIDTDVNGAAVGEWRWGAAQHCNPALYITIGTGIGGGAVVGGRPLHGLLHPEMGHIPVPRLTWPDGRPDDFPGVCRFHGACLEGVASGAALQVRLGRPAAELDSDHPVWELEAGYIAWALATYVLTLSAERIVLGGGVMQQAHLLGRVRRHLPRVLAGYVPRAQLDVEIERYVVEPQFGQDAGLVGAFALAEHHAAHE